jgi:hypothetical protein
MKFDSHESQLKNGYLVEERIRPLMNCVRTLKAKFNRRATTLEIVHHYQEIAAMTFTEEQLFCMRIVVTERVQVRAYEKILRTLLLPCDNHTAIDEWSSSRSGGTTETNIPTDVKNKLLELMVAEHGLEHQANLAPGSNRCISSNEAGRYLVKGMRVRIVSIDNNHLVIQPYDVTGQNLDYGHKVLERIEKAVDTRYNGTKYTLVRKQYPVTVGCAATASSIAGLTFNDPVVLDNTRTALPASFYIFSGRNKDPKNIYLRHRLVKALRPLSRGDNYGGAQGLYFDVKVYHKALLFNEELDKRYKERPVSQEDPIRVLKAPAMTVCTKCKLFICICELYKVK